ASRSHGDQGGNAVLFDAMTRNPRAAHGLEQGRFAAAACRSVRTTRMKCASCRRVEWIRNFARDGGARLARHVEIRHRIEEHPGVRVPWRGEQLLRRRELDDA